MYAEYRKLKTQINRVIKINTNIKQNRQEKKMRSTIQNKSLVYDIRSLIGNDKETKETLSEFVDGITIDAIDKALKNCAHSIGIVEYNEDNIPRNIHSTQFHPSNETPVRKHVSKCNVSFFLNNILSILKLSVVGGKKYIVINGKICPFDTLEGYCTYEDCMFAMIIRNVCKALDVTNILVAQKKERKRGEYSMDIVPLYVCSQEEMEQLSEHPRALTSAKRKDTVKTETPSTPDRPIVTEKMPEAPKKKRNGLSGLGDSDSDEE